MEAGTGECPTSTLQMTPERVYRKIHLPVGTCSAQSPSFHRCPRNPMTIQSIIDDMKFERPHSHKAPAKPMPSIQVNLFSWVERSFHYTLHEVLIQQEHKAPKKMPTGPTPLHLCPGGGCDGHLARSRLESSDNRLSASIFVQVGVLESKASSVRSRAPVHVACAWKEM